MRSSGKLLVHSWILRRVLKQCEKKKWLVDNVEKNYEDIREKVEPLRRLSGAKTAKMGAETSDAMLKVLISSLKKDGRLKELDEILWGEGKGSTSKKRSLGVNNCPKRPQRTMRSHRWR